MTYTVLARRYRSRTFDEVVGQEAIARTLQTAIASDRVGHAYLFCGTRGVGKTTMARLFAAAINVTDELTDSSSVNDAIMRGEDLDVIEIDGASNRGVQEARDLIANAGLSPSRSPYKIYIIDEVHMLTTESFNTLLKTMEEPPAHVKFILCTTEPKRVLHTIQSRCQRFDFRPIPGVRIGDHLRSVLAQEGVTADDEVIARVADLGNGSMRDALSVLERLLATGDAAIDAASMDQILGLPQLHRVAAILESVLDGDPGEALRKASALLEEGTSLDQALERLVESLRALLLMVTCGDDTDLLEMTESTRSLLATQAARLDAPGALYLLSLCEHASRAARLSASARAVFDATIVRMALAENIADVQTILRGDAAAPPVAKAAAPKKKCVEQSVIAAATEQPRKTPAPQQPRPTPPASTAPGSNSDSIDLDSIWALVTRAASTPSTRATVGAFEPVRFADDVLHLRLKSVMGSGFHRSRIDSFGTFVSKAVGRKIRVRLDEQPSDAQARMSTKAISPSEVPDSIREAPAVLKAVDLLDAVIVGVDPPGSVNESSRSSNNPASTTGPMEPPHDV